MAWLSGIFDEKKRNPTVDWWKKVVGMLIEYITFEYAQEAEMPALREYKLPELYEK